MNRDNQINFLVYLRYLFGRFWLVIIFLSLSTSSNAEPLRIAYTSIAVVYGPLWITQEAGIFKKYGIDPEIIDLFE